jgi:RNA polymerase sigma factor (TIGR02999 family)
MFDEDITQLLNRWQAGDKAAEARIIEQLYPIMKRQALAALGAQRGDISLSATDLVHESYLRLLQQRNAFQNRQQFVAIAATVLKRVLMDLWRAKAVAREVQQELASIEVFSETGAHVSIEMFSFFQRMESLEKRDPTAAKLVEMRLFGGLSNEEASEILGIGVATGGRYFAFARAWLSK